LNGLTMLARLPLLLLLTASTVAAMEPSPAMDPQDGITLTVAPGPGAGQVSLSWTAGPGGPYTIYRSTSGPPDDDSVNALGTTSALSWTDTPPAGPILYYRVSPAPFWTRDISTAPVDPQSSAIIAGLAAAGGFGNGRLQIDFSIDVLTADASVPFLPFTPTGDFFSPDCDLAPVPVPPGGAVEGESGYSCTGGGDCHLLVVHQPTHTLYEMWRADITGGVFTGGCLAIWDLGRIYPPSGRGEQCTSADAGGFPMIPLLFTADELQAGAIHHAIRFILPNSRIQAGVYVHPATHAGGPTGQGMPPYGARLRLRADYPLASLPDEGARIIARALQRYGMILADGGNIALTAANDRFTAAKWSTVLPSGSTGLAAIHVTDFEMIDGGSRIPLTYDCVRNP
jgi:serine/threonine-protein kinase